MRTMPIGLSTIARRFLTDEEGARRDHQQPLLVLEAPPEDRQEALYFATGAGKRERPRSGEGIVYVLEKAPGKPNAFAMGVTVGRTENNDVVLEDNSVSRFHAYFQKDPSGGWRLVDAESTCGTFVGLLRLTAKQPFKLPPMARVRFGELELFYFEPEVFFQYLQGHVRP
jgi:hypothetical protein